MTMTNEQLQEMYNDFVSENNKYKKISKMIWDTLFFYAGDSFITMNKKERDQFFRTHIVYDDLAQVTRRVYKRAFDNIADFVEGKPRNVIYKCECNNKTKLVHIPRNKDNKTNDSDYDKLCERISSFKKSMNLTEQEMNLTEQEINLTEQKLKDLKQKFEELKNKFTDDKCKLAKFERLQKESRRIQEEVKEVLSY